MICCLSGIVLSPLTIKKAHSAITLNLTCRGSIVSMLWHGLWICCQCQAQSVTATVHGCLAGSVTAVGLICSACLQIAFGSWPLSKAGQHKREHVAVKRPMSDDGWGCLTPDLVLKVTFLPRFSPHSYCILVLMATLIPFQHLQCTISKLALSVLSCIFAL